MTVANKNTKLNVKTFVLNPRYTSEMLETSELAYFYPETAEACEMWAGPDTVKPFDLAALKVDDFACRIDLAPFILVNSSHAIPTHE